MSEPAPLPTLQEIQTDLASTEWTTRERGVRRAGTLLRALSAAERPASLLSLVDEASRDDVSEVRAAVALVVLRQLSDPDFAGVVERLRGDVDPYVRRYVADAVKARRNAERAAHARDARAAEEASRREHLSAGVDPVVLHELRRLERAPLRELSSAAAHNLDTALMALRTSLTLLGAELAQPAPSPETCRELLASAERHGVRIEKVSRDLRWFAIDEPPPAVAVGLRDLVSDALQTLQGEPREPEVTLDLNVGRQLVVQVPRELIKDALRIVLQNAFEAVSGHGRISVAGKLVGQGEQVALTIRDTGNGIRPELLQRLLHHPAVTTKQREGAGEHMGMGLFVARRFIEDLSGGEISLQSSPGAGTTVTIQLPTPSEGGDTSESGASEE